VPNEQNEAHTHTRTHIHTHTHTQEALDGGAFKALADETAATLITRHSPCKALLPEDIPEVTSGAEGAESVEGGEVGEGGGSGSTWQGEEDVVGEGAGGEASETVAKKVFVDSLERFPPAR